MEPDSFLIPWGELLDKNPTLRPPVIEGLLRRGETMNIIANSKVGKSWLVNDLALSVATGKPWLGLFPTVQGTVLLIDNELHPETIAHRLRAVAEANGVDVDGDDRRITVWALRGKLLDMGQIAATLAKLEPGAFSFIIVDAFYRVLLEKMDENSNADMASVYNRIDTMAETAAAGTALVHHSSKGNQTDKAVTDVGSGAGSISRAADTHLILRRHQEEGAYVLDLALRSWPARPPLCLRRRFPRWELANDLDPADLWTARRAAKKSETPFDVWDAERLACLCPTTPTAKATIHTLATRAGCPSERKARQLLEEAILKGLVGEQTDKAGAAQNECFSFTHPPSTPPVGT